LIDDINIVERDSFNQVVSSPFRARCRNQDLANQEAGRG